MPHITSRVTCQFTALGDKLEVSFHQSPSTRGCCRYTRGKRAIVDGVFYIQIPQELQDGYS